MYRFFFMINLLFILLVGCNDSNKVMENRDVKLNLIESHIDYAKDRGNPFEERKHNLEKAYGVYSTLDDNNDKIEKIHEIALEYYYLKDYDQFKNMNEKALKLSISLNDSLNIAKTYSYLGIYYRKSKQDVVAYENLYEAEKIYSIIDNNKSEIKDIAFDHGKVLIDIARIQQRAKDYSESEASTIAAIKKFEVAENSRFLPLCYANLGILAKYLERFDEAIEYELKAIKYAEKAENEIPQKVFSYNNIGAVYKSWKKYDKAKEYYNKALSYTEYLKNNPSRYARILDNLAYVNFLSNDNEDIPNLFFRASKIMDSMNNKRRLITNTLHLAEYYKSIENDSVSKVYAERSRDLSLELQDNEELLKAYQFLSEISDSNEGLSYANKYIALNDSLIKQERLFRDKFARIQFETDEIAEENLQMSKENQILIIAILGLTALFLLGYIIFRQQQSNKELLFAQTQQEANQEIYRLLLNQQIKLEEGRQLEQQRMSEELHDGVLGRLFGVRLSLDGINQRANDGFTEARNKYIDELKSIEKEIRLISHDLGAETLPSDVAYIDAVEDLIKDLCAIHKIDFEFNNDEDIDWEEIDDQKKVNFFRILQESMQNIFKHADAENIKIDFDYLEDKINLTILDDGIGFKSTKVKKGIGLKNITSRVSQMSGVVQFLSEKDEGTKVAVSVPV